LEIPIVESGLQRASLYVADELFFSGTAAEITPIRSVDRITVGEGRRGPVTERIQKLFFEITSGEREAPGDWLTFVKEHKAATQPEPNGHHAAQTEEVRKAATQSTTGDTRDAIHVTLTE
jgi:branched-chain amino acid aminotransferase